MTDLRTLATQILERAKALGADAAEVYLREGTETEVEVRDGTIDRLATGQPRSVGIRVWRGDHSASTYGTDFSETTLNTLLEDALTLAPLSDPVAARKLAPRELLATEFPDYELYDASFETMTMDERIAFAHAAEAAAMGADARVTVSGGASWSDGVMHHVFATSEGFLGESKDSWGSAGVQVIADDTDHRKRNGGWHSVARFREDLLDAQELGRKAAQRAVEGLGSGPIETGTMPVVFDPWMAASLFSALFGALTGDAVERGASWLADLEGQAIASELITLIDDPTRTRGLGSTPFDGEGLPARPTTFIDRGVLQGFALNVYNAAKLGRTPTGHASRPASGAPGEASTNLYVQAGTQSSESIIEGVDYGFYCQSMMGFGFNPATGDFSRGATGFLIEKGKLTRPVSEVTISGNYKKMLMDIDAVGSDLFFDRSTNAPTIRIASMTVAGK